MNEQDSEVKTRIDENGEEVIDESILKEKETPSESSTDEKPDESEKVQIAETPSEETEEVSPEVEIPIIPKEVEGETPRERALRKELERVRKITRDKRKDELLPKEEVVESDELLKQYNPDEVANFKKLAKAIGLVEKTDIHTSQMSDIFDGFISQHPEYLPENDKDDVLWKSLSEEFNTYRKPTSSKELKNFLEKAHKQVIGLSGGKPLNKQEIEAKQSKIKSAAHGGITISSGAKDESKLDPGMRKHLKGFSDDDLKELGI